MNSTVTNLLNWLLGVDVSDVPSDAVVRLAWSNAPQSLWVFVLLLVVALAVTVVSMLYIFEQKTCSRRAKLFMASVRICVLLALLAAWLEPTLEYSVRRTVEPLIVVMRDASQSMNTPDRYDDAKAARATAQAMGMDQDSLRAQRPSRVRVLNEVLSKEGDTFVRQLENRGKVRVLDFSDHVEKQETRPKRTPINEIAAQNGVGPVRPSNQTALAAYQTAVQNDTNQEKSQSNADPSGASSMARSIMPLLEAQGRGTDLQMAIEESLSSNPLAAVVLFTDGQHTAPGDPMLAAQLAKEKDVPLFIVGVGDPARPLNIRMARIYARPQAWQGEPFEIEGVLTAEGVGQRDIDAQLIEQKVESADGKLGAQRVVGNKNERIPAGGGQVRFAFDHTAEEPGRFVYTIRVNQIPDERTTDDNQVQSAPVQVLSRESIRVLLVAGAPSWEYRMLQRLFTREKTVTLSCWLQTLDEERSQEGNRQITQLPRTREELFYYDVLMLLDPNPDEFDGEWIELLKQFCGEHSGGLLYMAGPKYSGVFLTGSRTKTLRDVLPVRFGDVGAMEVASLLSTNHQAWPLRIVSANVDHPVMSFYQDRQESLSRWENLPGIYWSFPAQGPKATARVLVEHSDPTLRQVEGSRPLLITGRYASGNTIYVGFNGTWRWRRVGRQAEFFDRFWIQVVRYLVEGRSLEGQRRGFVQTDRDRYEIGDKINVTARLQDISYRPLTTPEIEAVLRGADGATRTVVLRKLLNQPGQYESTLTARRTGVHNLKVTLPGAPEGASPGIDLSNPLPGEEEKNTVIEAVFTVDSPTVETNQVWLNKPLLNQISMRSGGRYFDINQLDELAEAIPDRRERVLAPQFPISLWDTRGLLLLAVALLSVEWASRKLCKLL